MGRVRVELLKLNRQSYIFFWNEINFTFSSFVNKMDIPDVILFILAAVVGYVNVLTHFMLMFLLFPLKTSEHFWFSDVFKGYRKVTLTWNGLIIALMKVFSENQRTGIMHDLEIKDRTGPKYSHSMFFKFMPYIFH